MGNKDVLEGALPMFLTELNTQAVFVLRFNPQILDQLFQSISTNPTQVSTLKFSSNSMFIDISTPDGVKVVKFNFTREDKPCFLVQRHSDHWSTIGQIKGKFVSQSTELLAVPATRKDHQVKCTEILTLDPKERHREGRNSSELQRNTKTKVNLIRQTPRKKIRSLSDQTPRLVAPSVSPSSNVANKLPYSDSSSSSSSSSCSEEEASFFSERLDLAFSRDDGHHESLFSSTDGAKLEKLTEKAREGSAIELSPIFHPAAKFPKINGCNGFSQSSSRSAEKPLSPSGKCKTPSDTIPLNQNCTAIEEKPGNTSAGDAVEANGFEENRNSDNLAKLFDLKFSEVTIPTSDWPHSRSIHSYSDFRACYDSFKRAWPYYVKMYEELVQSQSSFRTLLAMYNEAQHQGANHSFRQRIEEFYNLQEPKFLSLRNQYTLIHNEMITIRKTLQDYSTEVSKANGTKSCKGIE
ncbi:uncharacterized protein LOC126318682 [Schistocerca gregaria]|uniref:uncharacterized protein LOC126318682 n=1 Tax=Schistocerca gregaria TaxID=7010 RepID=UPI00211E8042|nr:uncharacterized protein LOC126318682 [Schistocerca gregaria]